MNGTDSYSQGVATIMTQYGSNSSGGRIVDQLFYGQGQYVLCQAGLMVGPALYQNVPWGHPVTLCLLPNYGKGNRSYEQYLKPRHQLNYSTDEHLSDVFPLQYEENGDQSKLVLRCL